MTRPLVLFAVFALGAAFGRWDAHHGAAAGLALGKFTRRLFTGDTLGHNDRNEQGNLDD